MSHQEVTDESFQWHNARNDAWFGTFPIGQFRFFWLWNDLWLSYINFHLSSFSNLTSGFTSGGIIINFIFDIISSAIKCRVVAAVNLMPFITRASPVGKILIWFSYKFRAYGPLTPPVVTLTVGGTLILKTSLTATTSKSWLCIINKPRKRPSLIWIII